ncbi:two-component regulator propeller domain-containing protein [Algibacter sp. L1A34]|uniref:hybrid sensor histidine kinase/response regulator transcription factor n=1 Tax=Algibacter sp. L1A34 TaxID=2686365 RepID=UPI00131B9D99|nr:two-component regulator propeller domain-containing protein [Algibacter sp. L1A34]
MKKKYWFFVCYLLLLSLNIWAQKPSKKFAFVNIKESVSKIGVHTIIQDQHDFIWIGTNGTGLNRFDGIDYRSYKSEINDSTSLSSNTVNCSFLDSKNRLWFGTDNGINLYDDKNDRFKRIKLIGNEESKTILRVTSIKGDKKGDLFVGTYGLGLYKINSDTFKAEKITEKGVGFSTPLIVNALEIDANGQVYVATDEGIKQYNPDTNTLDSFLYNSNKYKDIVKENFQCLLIDQNNLWAGSMSKGLYKIKNIDNDSIESRKLDKILISENRTLSILKLPDGSIMSTIENDGLYHMNNKGDVFNHYLSKKTNAKGIMSNSIWVLFLDHNERIWMGYYNAGIGLYDELYDKFDDIESLPNNPNSLQNAAVTAITKDEFDKIWIAMDGGGIDVYNPNSDQFTHINSLTNGAYSGITNDYIESLFIDSKKNIWAGSWNQGLYFLKYGTKKFINYNKTNKVGELESNNILSIAEDLEGTIWFASWDKGLHSYNPNTKKFTHHESDVFIKHGIVDAYSRKIIIDKKGNLWLATTNKGLFKINKLSDGNFSITSMASRMSKEFNNHSTAKHVLSLAEGTNGSIWIGTRGAGLCKYNIKLDTLFWYNKLNGLEAINITSVTEDLEGNIWLSSNSGITKLDVKTDTFTQFTKNDGLLSNDFYINSTFRDDDGSLYFGNYKGIDYFKPSNILVNNTVPSLYLTGFKLFNETIFPNKDKSPLESVIGETNHITLNHKESVFTIEYTGINYTRPEKNQYAYYLEGLEENWNYVGDLRSATYTNLDHGEYTFKLKSSNSDGVWNDEPLSLDICVLPPWWKTYEALFIYIILFVSGIYFLNRLAQLRMIEKQAITLEQNKRLQEAALNEKKFQFFTNISHEFRTPLTLIMNPINDIIKDHSLNLPLAVKQKHNIIYKNTQRLYRLINELLDFRKLELNKARVKAENLNLVDFTKDIVGYFKEEALSNGIDLNLDADVTNIPLWCDASMMEKVIFNILSNALKVTPRGGSISIDLESTDTLYVLPLVNEKEPVQVVKIIISDTGPGIEEEEVERIFERFYQSKSLNKGYYGGTGIGLEVVRDFISLHKGAIKVESKIGEGTTFTIKLPAGNTHFNEAEIRSESTELQNQKERLVATSVLTDTEVNDTPDAHKYTLLIVEDNIELLDYLKQEIGSEYKVLLASNGKKGLELAKELLPDVIMTDVMMPEMDGVDFCKHIKSDIRTSHIPLLMLTAKAKIEDRMDGIEVGADAYMVKPFDMRLLRLRLSQLITSRQLIFNKYFSAISEMPEGIRTSSIDKEFIEKVLNHIHKNIENPELNVGMLADKLSLSRSQFYRKIKALTNQTANEFLRNIRLQKAKQILETGNVSISEVCFKTGFSSPSYFTKCFKSYFDILPTEVFNKNK